MHRLMPLRTERKLVEPIWGGSRLAAWLHLPEPVPERLGESWQVFDRNRVDSGPFAGYALAELAADYGPALVGTRSLTRYGADFPLLAKFLDAEERLSIQVHPDDSYAHSHEPHTGFHGKTEAWYILDAVPGATVTYGLKAPSSRDEFAAAVAAGTVEGLMAQVPVTAGDVIFVPAGTLHAINAGIMLFEIQEKSDLTYRVYDYGRLDAKTGQPRKLHLAQALAVSEFAPAPVGKVRPLRLARGRDLLVACAYFALERWSFGGPVAGTTDPGTFEILTLIGGSGELTTALGTMTLGRGDSVVLPATLGNWTMQPVCGQAILLRAYVPDLAALTAEALRITNDEQRVAAVVRQ